MPRLLAHRLYIANLQGEFPENRLGHIPPDEARRELVRMTGQDFGLDGDAWEAWFKANPVRVSVKDFDLKDVRRTLAEDRRRRQGRGDGPGAPASGL